MRVCFGTVSGGLYSVASYAVGIGPIRAQDDGTHGGYGAVAIAEGGDCGDGVRVLANLAEDASETTCTFWANNTSFPAQAVDGNFNIREK